MQPYTEAANKITTDIDISKPAEIVEKLKQCDFEMFQPCGLTEPVKKLQNVDIISSICEVAKVAKKHLEDESRKSMIVMSGCGTSGRIAFMMARTYSRLYSTKKFAYLIAGGDKALFTSQEAPEDDYVTGRNDLIKATQGKDRVLYIGITCGLSAPYVAGQLDYCMDNLDVYTPVLLGFNPVALARKVSISNWDKTFFDVAKRVESLAKDEKTFVINPVVMGEAITGSSRMKGGTMTKILLDVILTLATSSVASFDASHCQSMLSSYENGCKTFYKQSPNLLSKLLTSAGASLKSDGHLYYASSGETGVLGIIDATECTPTYGSDLNDVRGFIKGGYTEYDNNEGDISQLGENYEINLGDFAALLSRDTDSADRSKSTIIITVTSPVDPVIKDLQESEGVGSILKKISDAKKKNNIFVVCLFDDKMEKPELPQYLSDVTILRMKSDDVIADAVHSLLTPNGMRKFQNSLLECWAKWTYNCVSTGGHVLKGKVMKNYMVDLKVSNQKLFHRSIGIIQVIPTAIVMAHKQCGFEEARNMLRQYHVIREAIAKLTNQ